MVVWYNIYYIKFKKKIDFINSLNNAILLYITNYTLILIIFICIIYLYIYALCKDVVGIYY